MTGRRLAVVSDAIHPFNKGGKELRIHELTQRLGEAGLQVELHTMTWWRSGAPPEHGQVRLQSLCPLLPLYSGSRRSIRQALVFSVCSARMLFRPFDVLEADAIPFLHLFPLKVVTLLRRKPLVVTWHEVWGEAYWRSYLGRMGVVAAALERLCASLPDHIIAASSDTGRRLEELTRGRARITVIPNGISAEEYVDVAADPAVGEVLVVGRLLDHKNVDLVVEALHLLRDTRPGLRLTVIGEGPAAADLHKQAARLGVLDRVDFRGAVATRAEVLQAMAGAQVLAFPSVREGFGMVALEALASGLPVVTAEHPDNFARTLITDDANGYVVAPTAEAIASALDRALSAHDRLAAEAPRAAEAYDWDVLARAAAEVYAS